MSRCAEVVGGSSRGRRRGRPIGAALLLAALLVALPQAVAAHALLVRTDPPDGTVLDHAPRTLELWFSAPVVLEQSSFHLVDGQGGSIPVVSARYLDDAHTRLLLALPGLSTS